MAVNPIDLQTNFMQVSNVGKQQALAKEHEVLRQDHASEHLNKTGAKDAEDVPETKKISEESGKVKNDQSGQKKKKKQTSSSRQLSEDENEWEDEEENGKIYRPGIGRNIDLSI